MFLGSLLKLSCVIDIFATFENPQIIFVKPALAVRIEFYEKIETNVGKPHWSGAVMALFETVGIRIVGKTGIIKHQENAIF